MSNFLKAILPFAIGVASANFAAGTPTRTSSLASKTAPQSKGVISNFLNIQDTSLGRGIDKFVGNVAQYNKAAMTKMLQERGLGGGTTINVPRIGGSKVESGSPLAFKAGAVDLKIPGSSNQRVLQKASAAAKSELFNQIVSASLKSSPRLGRTINLGQKNIKVKSRINPETVKV
tara:strand:- start:1692 stop:2216 length:525 start_codon:yes stop_codon:yes gene_type:complete